MCLWSNGCTECGLSLLLPKMCIRSWLKSWNERKTSTWKCETWNEKTSSSKLDLEESKNAAIDKTTGKNQAKSTSGGWKSRRSSITRLPCSSWHAFWWHRQRIWATGNIHRDLTPKETMSISRRWSREYWGLERWFWIGHGHFVAILMHFWFDARFQVCRGWKGPA